jgi:hypothetical protein
MTLIVPDWIERTVGIEPDQHSGSVEWLLVALCACGTVTLAGAALREWRLVTRSAD